MAWKIIKFLLLAFTRGVDAGMKLMRSGSCLVRKILVFNGTVEQGEIAI